MLELPINISALLMEFFEAVSTWFLYEKYWRNTIFLSLFSIASYDKLNKYQMPSFDQPRDYQVLLKTN